MRCRQCNAPTAQGRTLQRTTQRGQRACNAAGPPYEDTRQSPAKPASREIARKPDVRLGRVRPLASAQSLRCHFATWCFSQTAPLWTILHTSTTARISARRDNMRKRRSLQRLLRASDCFRGIRRARCITHDVSIAAPCRQTAPTYIKCPPTDARRWVVSIMRLTGGRGHNAEANYRSQPRCPGETKIATQLPPWLVQHRICRALPTLYIGR